MNERNCLDRDVIVSILNYLPWNELNNLAGLVLSSNSKEITDELYNETILNDHTMGECLMIYSWHDQLWKDKIVKKVKVIEESVMWNFELKEIRENYRLMFIKELWKRINWDQVQHKRKERISYIDNIHTRMKEIAKSETLYKNSACEKIIRNRIDQNFFIEESLLKLPLYEMPSVYDLTKWVSMGASNVGKTSLLIRFTTDTYDDDYKQVLSSYPKPVRIPCRVDGIDMESETSFEMWDTGGQEEYDKLRPLSYPDTKIFTMEYAINSMLSLKYLAEHLLWECSYCEPDATFVVISTKNDLYWNSLFNPEEKQEESISREEGIKFAKSIGAVAFIETSAKTGQGTQDLDVKLAMIRHLHLKHLHSKETCQMQTAPKKKCTLQ